MRFDPFNNPALMFRACECSLFKGDWSDQKTQSTSDVEQTDSRVGASENAIAIGAGANYQTNDQSDRSFTDQSTVNLITQDQRSYIDNSTTLDGEVANMALGSNVAALQASTGVLEKQIEASRLTTAKTLDANTAVTGSALDFADTALTRSTSLSTAALEKALEFGTNALDGALKDTAAARAEQSGFLSSFYTDRENNDTKVTGDLIKYAGAAAIVGLLAWAAKGKPA